MQLNKEAAIKHTLELVGKMIESANERTSPETVIKSMEMIYNYLTSPDKPES